MESASHEKAREPDGPPQAGRLRLPYHRKRTRQMPGIPGASFLWMVGRVAPSTAVDSYFRSARSPACEAWLSNPRIQKVGGQGIVLRTCQVTDGGDVRVAQGSVLRTCQVTDGGDVRVAQGSVLRTCQVTDGGDVHVAQGSVLRTCQVTDGGDVRVAQGSVLRTCQVTDGGDVRVAQGSVLRICQVTDGGDVRIAQGSDSPTLGGIVLPHGASATSHRG
jgi:hypothetical protein